MIDTRLNHRAPEAVRWAFKLLVRAVLIILFLLILITVNDSLVKHSGTGNRNGSCAEYFTGGATC